MTAPEPTPEPNFLDGPNGRLAYRRLAAAGPGSGRPGVVWLGGFNSDMTGTKASFLAQWAEEAGRAFLRFDYSGHGASSGAFEDGGISDWTADALAAFDATTDGPQILVGSSMGAWIATLLALQRAPRIAGIVFIAPASDFTEELMWKQMSEATRQTLLREGRIEMLSEDAAAPTIITRKLIEDGRNNLVLGASIAIDAPVRILQGMADPDVPWSHAMRLATALTSRDLAITLTKSGDHRLSTPDDLRRLVEAINEVS